MRFYRIGSLTVDTQAPVLISTRGEDHLEPRVHELLLLFCRNPGRLITRDEILEAIWRGGIVSDNAVSKLVARLRQALGDDSRSPTYILTVARRGYRLAATVDEAEALPVAETTPARRRVWLGALIALGIIVLLVARAPDHSDSGPLPIRALTRHSGTEFAPAVSPDGRFLAYTHRESVGSPRELWLKNLDRETESRLELEGGFGDVLAWAPDSRRLALLSLVEGACRVRALTLDDEGEMTGSEDLFSCADRSIGDLVYSPSGDRIYYTSRERAFAPVQVHVEYLAGAGGLLLAQPPLVGAGNYSIDLSPRGDKLLILAADAAYRTQAYVLVLDTQSLSAHVRFDHFLDEAVWHHDNESIVHLSAPLGYEVVRSTLGGESLGTLASTSNRVVDIGRHPNGRDFYFSSFQMNNDIIHVATRTGETQALDNTAVYENMPSLSAHSNRFVFLSNRGGRTQVYRGALGRAGSRPVTQFDDSRLFVSLALSPDDSRIVMATYNELLVVDLETGDPVRQTTVEGLILSANWLGVSRVAVSRLEDDQPRLFIFDPESGSLTPAPGRWAAAATDLTAGTPIGYAVEGDGSVFRTGDGWADAKDTGLRLPRVFLFTGLNLKAANGRLYYQRNDGVQSILVAFDPATGRSEDLGSWGYVAGFDVGPHGLILSHEVGRVGDVVTTQGG